MRNGGTLFLASSVCLSHGVLMVDFIRTFTWDKKLESWVKERGFVGGGTKEPTIVTPRQYKNRSVLSPTLTDVLVSAQAWRDTFYKCRIVLVFMIFGEVEIPALA